MPYPLSDDESSDSDSGVRFKTANTRDKFKASSSSSAYNTKSDKSDNKHSLYKNSHRESKSKSSVKYRHETSSSRRHEDRYSRRSSGSEKSHSSSYETTRRCSIDDKINSRRKRFDDSHCSKEKEKVKRKISPQRKKITKTDNSSRQDDSIAFGPSLPTKNTNVKELKPENSELSQISKNESCIGPALPEKPQRKKITTTDNNSSRQDDSIAFGPSLPTKNINVNKELKPEIQNSDASQISKRLSKNKIDNQIPETESCIGPALPEKLVNNKCTQKELNFNESDVSIASSSKIDSAKKEQQNYFGPSLPPKISVPDSEKTSESVTSTNSCKNKEKENASETLNTRSKIVGPLIPDHLRVIIANESDNTLETSNKIKSDDSDSEDCIIGPLPAQQSLNTELEERALQMKLDLLNKTDDKSATREEWMLELPEIRSVAQALGPRKFRAKEMPDLSDRSMWTETAKDKTNKKTIAKTDIKLEANLKNLREKDLIQEKIVEKQKKSKRNKSLIDLHAEELQKKKAKDDSIAEERRPFSRDIDLKINRFDDAQTKAIIKKARLLDNKFASGQSKFL